jgi:predicted nuclease of predicted toxin-antitoxin system
VSVRSKIDEDVPRQIADLLNARGHDAATVVGQGWQGMPDEILWPRVQQESRWLITADKGFADLRQYPPGTHAGVILLRSQEESRRAYLELATMAIERLKLDEIAGAIVVVTYRGVRMRRAPAKRPS